MTRKRHIVTPLDEQGRTVDIAGTHVVYLNVDDDEHAETQLAAKLADLNDLADRRHGLAVRRLRVVNPVTGDSFDWAP